jgi:membrane-associated protein
MLRSVLDRLADVSGSSWSYPVIYGLCALDVVFPVLPSETSVIVGGVVAGSGDLLLGIVIAVAAVGAITGDVTVYTIGRLLGERRAARLLGKRGEERVRWAERQLDERGWYLILVGRFIPGGRSAVTLSAGLLHMRWRRFLAADVAAGILWASYAALLGYVGGRAFEHEPWKGFVVAFVVALGVTGAVEVVRWRRRRQTSP